ncbi:uncharacterized protein stbd1 [Siniperca chuatsi]|uniref:uncharacterized protein stbd1 n=1 Tax=Siniperca chuatsi TaxID=119488 RepID=UPI001CE1EAE6|nr:uncharacterized protein stbd1 [Siniperca chuatsi]
MSSSHLHPFAALQQQEVTTLEIVEGRQQLQPAAASVGSVRPSCAHTEALQKGSFFSQQIAMPLKNGNTVAVERRVDLASLFCMIGRHGPAVALAVIAMLSVLAGFIIYRNVRGKRRKATAAAADSDSKTPGAERDASVIRRSPEETHSSVESTDVSDEGSSDVKEDDDRIQSDFKIRHRRAAAEKKPPPYSPPKSDIQVPDNKHTTSGDTEDMAVVRDSYKVAETLAEEANQSLQSDTYTVAEMVVEAAVDCHQGGIEDVIGEVHDDDICLKEPERINDENHEEAEKVLKVECQEDEHVTTDNGISDKKTRQEEKKLKSSLNNLVCFEQTPDMGEKGDDDRLQDNKTILETNSMESNSGEPVIYIGDVSAPCICYGKDEEFEEDNPDSTDCSSYSGNNHLSPDEEKKNEREKAEEECVDYHLIAQQVEMWSSTFERETNLPSTQQNQCGHVTDKVTPQIRDGDWDEDGGLAGEVIEEVIVEDHLNKLTAVKVDAHLPQFDEKEVEIEQKAESGLTCNQEDGVLHDGAYQVNENMLTNDNIVAYSEERDSSSVAPSPTLTCLSAPVKIDHYDNCLSGITTVAKAQISGLAGFSDLSSDCQQPQKEDKIAPSLDEDTDFTVLGPQMPSHETENQLENNKNGTTVVLAEECNDQAYDPHVQSCYKDQHSVKMINNDMFDKPSIAAAPDIVGNVTASVILEEISCPHLTSICQDQQSDRVENDKTFDETRVNSATDAAACDNASHTALLMSEEISHPDMLCSSQDQQSDQMKKDFSEVTTGAAPVMTEDISPPICQIHLPSFEQSELRDNDISSSGVGEESGISSMAVSPDLQEAGNEFDVTVENMMLPVMDCDLQSEGQTEAQNSLFADDVAISVINEDTVGMVFGPYQSRCSQPPHSEHTDWTNYESFAANEDIFGHEIENSYHRAMDQFTAQITARVTSFTDELKTQTDVKAVVEVVEIKEKKAGVSAEKKEETKAEKEKEEDYEKTEISIMEATMDNNEWITDSNYQVLPWMNFSAPSFTQDHTKNNQLPTAECHYSSAVTDTTCIDATDIPPSAEVKQTSNLSLVDENTENNKKVVAVQPMSQNVNVTFRIHYVTQSPYQTVAVTGNQQELGNWKGFIPLERAKDSYWATVISLPAESHVEWKFVLVDKGEICRWEECGNRLLDTGYGDDLLVHKWWGVL